MPAVHRILLVLFCSVQFAWAQDPVHRNYTIEDGLPSNTIYQIYQDSKGYIWFGTERGVVRFNGHQFDVFDVEDGLPSNVILCIVEDDLGRLWFLGSYGSISYFLNGEIFNEEKDPFLKNLKSTAAWKAGLKDSLGNTWLASHSQLIRLRDKQYWVYQHILDLQNFPRHPFLNSKGELSYLNFYFGIEAYKDRKHLDMVSFNDTFYLSKDQMPISPIPEHLPRNGRNFREDMISNENIILLKRQSKIQMIELQNHARLMDLYEYKNVKYLSTSNGYIVTDENYNFKRTYFRDQLITNCLVDNQGNLWVGSYKGLILVPNADIQLFMKQSWNGDDIYRMKSKGNKLLMGDEAGNLLEHQNGSFKMVWKSDLGSVPNDVFYTSDGCGAAYADFLITLATNKVNKRNFDFNKSAEYTKNGTIILGMGVGIKVIDENGAYNDYLFPNGEENRVYAIGEWSDTLWLATQKGLYRFKDGLFYKPGKDVRTNNLINNLAISPIGTIWMATNSDGLLAKKGDLIVQINADNGLENSLSRLIITKNNELYVAGIFSCYRVIFEEDPKSIRIKSITRLPYLPRLQINDLAVHENKLWLASNMGMIAYPFELLNQGIIPRPVIFEHFWVNGALLKREQLQDLNHRQNNIVIRFTSLDYKSYGHVEYRYRLSKHGDWFYSHANTITLNAIAPGKYQIEVQARSDDNSWSAVSAVQRIYIRTPWWKSATFITLFSLLLVVLISSIIWFRSRQQAALNNLKLQTTKAEIKLLRNQLNPHFLFNALNSIQDYILKNDRQNASKYLSDFAHLMRMILEFSRRDTILIEDEIDFLNRYISMEKLRFTGKFDFEITVGNDVSIEEDRIPSLLLQPFVENAIIHGLSNQDSTGLLSVRFIKRETKLVIEVEDNGKGINAEKNSYETKRESLALTIFRERVEQLNLQENKRITYQFDSPLMNQKGTKITLHFFNYFT